ncbi:major facilitator superfamily domain-containing protein [Microdochium bolleyi]|uniref:Major facilitator superfamily domain-containing protein n=1 Tax=Microdochium bolleyi TaxID=196109 RepID=A0A136JAU5_9PEZI|nr:major facilitator superfamily domain-containing protein [Microdochium bolleyi]
MDEKKGVIGPASHQSSTQDHGESSGQHEKNFTDIGEEGVAPSQLLTVSEGAPPPPPPEDKSDSGAENFIKDETYPEGGLEAWLVVFGAWCGLFASLGLLNTIATLQTYVAEHQLSDYNEGAIGWIFSIFTAVTFSCGVYIGPMFDVWGPRWLLASGALLLTAGIMATSVCTQYWHFILSFSILTGVGAALLFTPSVAAIGHFFFRRRGFASGLGSTAGGIGGITFPLILTKLFSRFDWGWSLRIVGFMNIFFLVLANLLVKKRLPAPKNASPHPDFRILKDKTFGLFTLSVFMLEFGLFIPVAYISSYGIAQGFPRDFSTGTLLAIFNTGSVFGRIIPGYLADKIGPFNGNMSTLCLSVFACFAVWLPFGHTMAGLSVFAFLFGFATGNNISVTPVCIGRLCRTQEYGRYYATAYVVAAVGCLIGIPIGGSIVAASGGEYWGVILTTGLSQAVALVCCYCAKGLKVGWNPLTKF